MEQVAGFEAGVSRIDIEKIQDSQLNQTVAVIHCTSHKVKYTFQKVSLILCT